MLRLGDFFSECFQSSDVNSGVQKGPEAPKWTKLDTPKSISFPHLPLSKLSSPTKLSYVQLTADSITSLIPNQLRTRKPQAREGPHSLTPPPASTRTQDNSPSPLRSARNALSTETTKHLQKLPRNAYLAFKLNQKFPFSSPSPLKHLLTNA